MAKTGEKHKKTRQKYITKNFTFVLGKALPLSRGPGSSVGIATELRAGRSEDWIPVEGEIFRTSPDRPWGPPSLLYNGYRVFPGG